MLYYLIQALEKDVAGLNAFRYTTSRTGAAMLTALFLVFMFGPGLISLLKLKQGRGQPIRADGPQRHLVEKQGTPTMGGSFQSLCLGRSVRDAGLRRNRLL